MAVRRMNDPFLKSFSIIKEQTASKLEKYIKTTTQLKIKPHNKFEMKEYENHLLEIIKRRTFMISIVKKQIAYNFTKCDRTVENIVIHDTGNPSAGANAEMHYRYFNGGNRQASADFFVDDKEIIQVNDYKLGYSWHCGDGGGKYGITNKNSIGIELCVHMDGNFTKTLENGIELVKQLKIEFPNAKLVRHYDASRKNCPNTLSANNWAKWDEFVKNVETPVELSFEQILEKAGLTNLDEWKLGIATAVNAAAADGNLGALEIFQFLPILIQKVYNCK